MNSQEFETKIQKEINSDLYIEDTSQEDLQRVMVKYEDKNIYICAFPKNGVREEVDKTYQSIRGQVFPSREIIESKIKNFLQTLPENISLYE